MKSSLSIPHRRYPMLRRSAALLAGLLILFAWHGTFVCEEEKVPVFNLNSSKVYKPGDEVTIHLESRNLEYVDFRVYKVDDPAGLLLAQEDPHYIKDPSLLKTKTAGEKLKGGWEDFQQKIKNNFKKRMSLESRVKIRKTLHIEAKPGVKTVPASAKISLLNEQKLALTPWREEVKQKEQDYWWTYQDVKIPVKDAGAYLVEGMYQDKKAYILVVVTPSGFLVTRSPNEVLVYACDRLGGEPLTDARIRFLRDKKVVKEGKTDKSGIYRTPYSISDEEMERNVVVTCEKGSDFSLSESYYYGSSWDKYSVYIYTERPVYRPNQTVYFKGIVRGRDASGQYSTLTGQDVEVKINDPKYNKVYTKTLKTNGYGSFTDSLTLSEEPPLGSYYIEASVEGKTYSGDFQVQEYKKPEYEVKVEYGKDSYVQGEQVTATVSANYYFGSPVTGAEVNYYIYRQRYYLPWWYWYGEDYGWFYEEESGEGEGDEYSNYGNELVKEGTGKLTADGKLVVKFKGEKLDFDAVYKVEARVTDKSRREIAGARSVKVTRGSFFLALTKDRWVYKPGEEVRLTVRAQDFANQAVNAQVTVKVEMESYANGASNYVEVATGDVKVTQGQGNYSFKPGKDGYYRVTAESKDAKGNAIDADNYVWVTSGTGWWYEGYARGGVQIIPDKPSYKAGETAHIFVMLPVQEGKALFTMEGEKLYSAEVRAFKGGSFLVDVPVKGDYSPNVYASVNLISKDQRYSQEKAIIVPPKDRLLTVKVESDKPIYKPQETASYTITTTDGNGKPVSAEVSLGVVDEAVYAIVPERTQEIGKAFYSRRYNKVSTSASFDFNFYGYSRKTRMEEADARKRPWTLADFKEGKAEKFAEARTRRDFRDISFWKADLVTDGSGKAKVKIKFPDNLTAWRATARAVTGDTKVGQVTQKAIVRKDLIVRMEAPRFLTQEDEMTIATIVHNYLSTDKTARVIFGVDGLEALGDTLSEISVPRNADVRVDFRIKARDPGDAILEAKALTNEESDAMELTVPVLPHGIKRYITKAGETNQAQASLNETLTLPDSAAEEANVLKIDVAPSLGGTMLEALDYLAEYPYGCVEQTMSCFLPDVVVSKTLKDLNLANADLEKKLPDMVKKGLARLYNFQHEDGGWGWWEHDETHPFMTAYVIYGLTQAKACGYEVSEEAYSRGVTALREQISQVGKDISGYGGWNEQQGMGDATKAYMLYVLSLADTTDAGMVNGLYAHRDSLNDNSKALLALTLDKMGKKNEARQVVAELEKNAKVSETAANWGGKSWHYSWEDDQIQTTAQVVRALAQITPQSGVIEKAIRWLILRRQGNAWNSTQDTAMIIYSLLEYMKASKELYPDYTLAIAVNGKQVLNQKVGKGDVGKKIPTVVVKGDGLKTGENSVTLTKSGRGKLYYTLSLAYVEHKEGIPAEEHGITVDRTFAKLLPVQDAKGRWVYATQPISGPVRSGQEILVRVKLKADQAYDYLMVEDPLPSGCEVIKEDWRYTLLGEEYREWYDYEWNYWFTSKEIRDTRMVFFVTHYEFGGESKEAEFTYILRAQMPGTFHVMPTQAKLMYFPEVSGSSEEYVLSVAEGTP
jgi:uncharacterized protein YfaS (alpha-2-macroglobulin family)